MPRPKSEPTYCIHSRSGRAYTTVDGRQITLGEANSHESREEFDRIHRIRGQWLANGRSIIHESTDELADFLARCEPLRLACDRAGLADTVGSAQRRAALLTASLRRLEAAVRDST